MAVFQLTLTILAFGCTLWMGVYLIGRDYKILYLWLSGLALIAHSIVLLLEMMGRYAPNIDLAHDMQQGQLMMILAVVLLWLLFMLRYIPNKTVLQERLIHNRRGIVLFILGTILFSLGIALYQFSGNWITPFTLIHLLAINLLVMGTAVAHFHARQEGEALWPHYLRSFDYSFFTALMFGGQIALVMRYGTGINFPMLTLLLATVATAVIVQIFAGKFTTWLDGIAFFSFPKIRQERATFRAGAEAVSRLNDSLDVQKISVDEFARLTRRALSQMGNLPKLAANPLTRLPQVSARLNLQGVQLDTLARATELKQLLTESIIRLKPSGEYGFGTTDEWRHYNALYFPYVVGLRPYRRQVNKNGLDEDSRKALDWFRVEVPLRTLYNWQNDAAHLIAKDLKDNSRIAANGS